MKIIYEARALIWYSSPDKVAINDIKKEIDNRRRGGLPDETQLNQIRSRGALKKGYYWFSLGNGKLGAFHSKSGRIIPYEVLAPGQQCFLWTVESVFHVVSRRKPTVSIR